MRKISVFVAMMLLSVCAACAGSEYAPWLPSFLEQKTERPARPKDYDTVTLYGEVDKTMAHDVVSAIENCNKLGDPAKPIMLYINSPGGYVDPGSLIVDAMISSKRPVYTVNVELAASMAAIIHQYGAKRFILRHAVDMFHDESGAEEGYVKHMASRIAITQRKFTDLESNAAKRIGITLDALREHESSEWWLMGQDAVDDKVADAIIEARDFPAPDK